MRLCICTTCSSNVNIILNNKKSHPRFPYIRNRGGFQNPTNSNTLCCSSSSPRKFTANGSERGISNTDEWFSTASPYEVLGVDESCSPAELKAAFRARVKEFHPDVFKDAGDSDAIIRRVLQAYEMLSKCHQFETIERESLDPFEEPECVAFDIFINEILCVGKGCPYSCVKRAPHAFSFNPLSGSAHAISQGHGEDYKVQLAVGQCPRSCIHYVTPSQRVILEELMDSVLNNPYSSAEAALLDSLTAKAKFENNRYQKLKKKPRVSTEYVDWF
eukprot:TRINITY_DN1121_c0_g1_i1.p1 TRINITY_DN1121_c0_g1~~TRINITY_DN1121_c0_g1_i1.p1  ORF type:complete len:274 (+),score=35.28 TRINITY_DN1121_c0_g1_i1:30-851(+)